MAGATHHIPRGYLARAALHRTTSNYDLAAKDLNDAADIADRSGMRLFQTDIALERARLTLARADPDAIAAATRLADAAAACPISRSSAPPSRSPPATPPPPRPTSRTQNAGSTTAGAAISRSTTP